MDTALATSAQGYEPPTLRLIGSVRDLTEGSLSGDTPDGLLVLVKESSGGVVNGSA